MFAAVPDVVPESVDFLVLAAVSAANNNTADAVSVFAPLTAAFRGLSICLLVFLMVLQLLLIKFLPLQLVLLGSLSVTAAPIVDSATGRAAVLTRVVDRVRAVTSDVPCHCCHCVCYVSSWHPLAKDRRYYH